MLELARAPPSAGAQLTPGSLAISVCRVDPYGEEGLDNLLNIAQENGWPGLLPAQLTTKARPNPATSGSNPVKAEPSTSGEHPSAMERANLAVQAAVDPKQVSACRPLSRGCITAWRAAGHACIALHASLLHGGHAWITLHASLLLDGHVRWLEAGMRMSSC